MSQRDPTKPNRNPRVTSSPSSPLSFTGGSILWAQAEGAGTVTLTDESGTATAFPLNDREAIMGPWLNLVSFTGCTAVRFGDGKVPIAPPVAAVAPAAASLAPFLAISVANVTALSGAQTVDGVALVAGNRVYLAKQTTGAQNGGWVVQTGNWTRPADWASGSSIPLGTQIQIAPGGTANFAAFGGTWYVDSGAVVDTDTIVAYPKVNKGIQALSSASPSTATVSGLWIKGTTASGTSSVAVTNTTTAANGIKATLTAGAGTGTLVLTGPNTVTDAISYIADNG